MLFVLRRNNIGPDLYVICSVTAGRGPGTKCGPKPGAARFAHPLRGAEVLGIWPDLYLFLEEIHRAGFLCY